MDAPSSAERLAVAAAVVAGLAGCNLYVEGEAAPADAPVDAATDAANDARVDAFIPPPIDAPWATPTIAFTAPAPATTITHHDIVWIDALVTGNPITALSLELDGVPVTGEVTLFRLPPGGDCTVGCNLGLSWDADAVFEGAYNLVVATVSPAGRAADMMPIQFEDAPEIVFVNPATLERRGAATVAVDVRVFDRGPGLIAATLAVDGITVETPTFVDCRFGCAITRTWHTATTPAGVHPLRVVATDGAARTTTVERAIAIADIPYVTRIRVAGGEEPDGMLEVEVHLQDSTAGWRGCSGADQGLAAVDTSGLVYDVVGWFIDAAGDVIGMDQLAGRSVVLSVVDDDLDPCPRAFSVGNDTTFGSSDPVPADGLGSLVTGFGFVPMLSTGRGRPLAR